jgi:hypothetical protein
MVDREERPPGTTSERSPAFIKEYNMSPVGADRFVCEKCGRVVPESVKVCPGCGANLAFYRCSHCNFKGTKKEFLGKNNVYCPRCFRKTLPGESSPQEQADLAGRLAVDMMERSRKAGVDPNAFLHEPTPGKSANPPQPEIKKTPPEIKQEIKKPGDVPPAPAPKTVQPKKSSCLPVMMLIIGILSFLGGGITLLILVVGQLTNPPMFEEITTTLIAIGCVSLPLLLIGAGLVVWGIILNRRGRKTTDSGPVPVQAQAQAGSEVVADPRKEQDDKTIKAEPAILEAVKVEAGKVAAAEVQKVQAEPIRQMEPKKVEQAKPKGPPLSQTELDRLVRELGSLAGQERSSAQSILCNRGDLRAIEALVRIPYFMNFNINDSVSFTLRFLLEKNGAEGYAVFIRAVNRTYDPFNPNSNKNQFTGMAAVKILDYLGARAVEPLITLLKDEDRTIREYAASTLGRFGDKRAIDPLVESIDTIQGAKDALAKLGWKANV